MYNISDKKNYPLLVNSALRAGCSTAKAGTAMKSSRRKRKKPNLTDKKRCKICDRYLSLDNFFVVPGNSTGSDWFISIACDACHKIAADKIIDELSEKSK